MENLGKIKELIKKKKGTLIIIGSKNFRHGTGRSLIAETLAEQLGAVHYSTGDKFREMAEEKNMNIMEFAGYAAEHPEIDKEFDKKAKEEVEALVKSGKNVVADSNLLAYFLKPDVGVLIDAPDELRAERVYKKHRKADSKYCNVQDALQHLANRDREDKERYEEMYGINTEELTESYDAYIYNDGTLEQTMSKVLTAIKTKLEKR